MFWILGWVGVGIGVLLSAGSFFLKHMAHGAFDETLPPAEAPSPTEGAREGRGV